jgi:3-hydroxyisobutyrate dehydrogenase-like beta-hydroxyacid dehydrogenase
VRLEPPAKIGFIGIGLMGAPMAANLIRAGFQLQVWNRTTSKCDPLLKMDATLATSPAEAARGANAVITMLESGATVTEVLAGGLLDALEPGSTLIDMSSIAPAIAEDHAKLVMARGVCYIDAPVSGGTVGAQTAKLAIMAGGLEEDVESARAIFSAMGSVTHVGPHGRGQLCKLVNQAIVAISIGAVSEGLLLAARGGANPAKVREAIMGGFCQSRILELHGQRIIDRNFAPGGTVKNQIKDLNAVLEVAGRLGLELPLTSRVRALFIDHTNAGGEMNDHSALYLQLEAMNAN